MMKPHVGIASVVTLLYLSPCWADQEAIANYAETRREHFYSLYLDASARDRTEIYCGIRFDVEERSGGGFKGPEWLSLEHAFPAQWMANSLGCSNRKECPEDPVVGVRFDHAEADMHNLWPAVGKLNSSRGQKPLGEIEGETTKEIAIWSSTFTCDFENDGSIVEPRKIVRGNLARSIFYMCKEYGFPVPRDMMSVLRKWNREDPPTRVERRRADRIAEVQGTRNAFIDDPALGDTVRCRSADWFE
jgi:deoxyribonuclease-1